MNKKYIFKPLLLATFPILLSSCSQDEGFDNTNFSNIVDNDDLIEDVFLDEELQDTIVKLDAKSMVIPTGTCYSMTTNGGYYSVTPQGIIMSDPSLSSTQTTAMDYINVKFKIPAKMTHVYAYDVHCKTMANPDGETIRVLRGDSKTMPVLHQANKKGKKYIQYTIDVVSNNSDAATMVYYPTKRFRRRLKCRDDRYQRVVRLNYDNPKGKVQK